MPITVTVVAPADPASVWEVLADVPGWPDWNPTCLAAEMDGPRAQAGVRLRLQLVHPKGRRFWTAPTITAVEPGRRLLFTTRALGFRAPTELVLTLRDDGETDVNLSSSSHGPLAFTYRLMFPEKAQGLLWSGALTGLARHLREGADTIP